MTKLAVIADIHYYSPSLGTTGRAYELRSGSDQKCLAESGAVTDAAFERLASSDADAVLIVGDITNNGERCSHDEIYDKCIRFREKKPLYLITSTHDWCSDNHARRYDGENVFRDVPTLGREEVAVKYLVFGEDTELARYETSKGFYSRVFQISPAVRLIAVNDDGDGRNGASGYSEEHMAWMIRQIRDARSANCDVIAMEHHLLLHNIDRLINKTQSIADNTEQAARLADAGLRLMLTGHSHMQRTTEFISPAGNRITQINVGSLCGYPAPMTFLDIENGRAHVKTEFLRSFTYHGEEYGQPFFREHTAAVFLNLLHAAESDKEDLLARLSADGIRIKALDTVYPLVRFAAKKALTVTVGKAGRAVNFLTFGRGVDKNAVRALKDDNLLEHILNVFLNVFDGSETARGQRPEVAAIVRDISTLPRRIVSKLPLGREKKQKIYRTTDGIEHIAEELMHPSAPDNRECDIDLC